MTSRLPTEPRSPDPHSADLLARLDQLLGADDADRERRFPGTVSAGQPVHTAYVPADRFTATTVADWGAAALAALDANGPVPGFADLDGVVRTKLQAGPIEDLRIDFEDGYGVRPDAEEDAHVVAAATAVGVGRLPAQWGIRMKCLEPAFRRRAVRTLDLFLEGIGTPAAGFRITLPKVTSVHQVHAMVDLCAAMESRHALAAGSLRFEIQVETPQAILGADGTAAIAPMIHAADGRCAGLHYGTYDYSASVGIAAAYQSMEHPAADYAKSVMQVAAAGTGIPLCDGSTNVLPVGDEAQVHAGWALHARLVRRSLERGFYQGWDLHPAQLPSRYAATFRFYADGAPAAVGRLRSYLARADSGVLDEPATARALARFLLRGLDCAAVAESLLEPDLHRTVLTRLATDGR